MAIKKINYNYESVHLLKEGQHSGEFVSNLNPMHQVPAIKVDFEDGSSHVITQSLAIIRFLEDFYPDNSVLPRDPVLKAKANAIADTIAGGIQPLQNLETLVRYTEPLGLEPLDQDQRKQVAQFWIKRKLADLEKLVAKTAGKFCVGDQVTIADVSLVPQMFNARRFGIDVSEYPVLTAIDSRLNELDAIKSTNPLRAPDIPENLRIP